jgi:hypothetical protein
MIQRLIMWWRQLRGMCRRCGLEKMAGGEYGICQPCIVEIIKGRPRSLRVVSRGN